ncbi:hypothetical protein HG530_002817 [Fusarium avenaceum]|nr:hypothetical protein HG530_002817 [Fusarium avenaceum]
MLLSSSLGSAKGSLLARISPPNLLIEKLRRFSPFWLLGRLLLTNVNRDAARDNLDAVDSSFGVMAGVTVGEWELGVWDVDSFQTALGLRESPARERVCRSGASSLLRGLSLSMDSRILGGLLDKYWGFVKIGVLSK